MSVESTFIGGIGIVQDAVLEHKYGQANLWWTYVGTSVPVMAVISATGLWLTTGQA